MRSTRDALLAHLALPVFGVIVVATWVYHRRRRTYLASLPHMDVLDLLTALRTGKVTSANAVEAFIARIEQVDAKLNAVVQRDFGRARRTARAMDRRRKQTPPSELGPLHGLPITVKEEMTVEGMSTCVGVAVLRSPDKADSAAVARLRAAGAIILGKTNIPVRCNDWQTYNPVYGSTENPWNGNVTPGGSSGGSAVAIAARLSALELGGDSAGSVRLPATFCGVWGIAPSPGPNGVPTGRSPRSMAVFGPIASSPRALAVGLRVARGDALDDPRALSPRALPPLTLRGLRLVLWVDDAHAPPLARAVMNAATAAATNLRATGARVDDTARPAGPGSAESLALFHELTASRHTVDARAWAELEERRQAVVDAWARFFAEGAWDGVIMPVAVCPAFANDRAPGTDSATPGRTILVDGVVRPYSDLYFWPHFAILAKLPAVALPAGLASGGSEGSAPFGLQVLGPQGSDERTILVAEAVHGVLPGAIRRPPPIHVG